MSEQGVENVLIVLFGEEIRDGFRHDFAEPSDIIDFRTGLGPIGCNTRGFTQCLEGTEIAGETQGGFRYGVRSVPRMGVKTVNGKPLPAE